jgi:cysteine-rich repeat protein
MNSSKTFPPSREASAKGRTRGGRLHRFVVAAMLALAATVAAPPKAAEACTDASSYYAGVKYTISGQFISYTEPTLYIGPNSPPPWPLMNGSAPKFILYTFAGPVAGGVRLGIGATNADEEYAIYRDGQKVQLTAASLTPIGTAASGDGCNIVGDGNVGYTGNRYCGTYITVPGPVNSTLEIRAVKNPGSGTVVDLDGAFITCGGCDGNYGSGTPKACPVSTPTCSDPGVNGVCSGSSCGDGAINQSSEGCDDGNKVGGDGCSATCKVETGLTCSSNGAGATGNASCASGICDAVGNAAPGKCEAALACGNGVLEAGEGCDDGNTSAGDTCSATCLRNDGSACGSNGPGFVGNASCASGICDALGNAAPGKCEPALTCGNGKLEAGEGCDDGNTAGNDGCSAACKIEVGGSCSANGAGVVGNASCATGVCDTVGNAAPGTCEAALTCGNGKLEAGEGCDDGNIAGNDGCSAACRVEVGGACNADGAGALGNASCASGVCDAAGNIAPGTCEAALTCGNGKLEAGEGCDDGNTNNGDACSATCKVETGAGCNANAAGVTGDGSCDTGVCNVAAGGNGVCAPALACGNGRRDPNEGCDDGNSTPGDGCTAACKVEVGGACTDGAASCASGVCDVRGHAAPGVCEAALTCGNGKIEAGEGCDDGNTADGDGCSATCKVDVGGACNGSADGLAGDASCTSGVCNDSLGKPGVCAQALVCGNGKMEAGEGCDDGNTADGDACTAACKIIVGQPCNGAASGVVGADSCASAICNDAAGAPGVCNAPNTCGNRKLEAGEGCDDGNAIPGDGCDSACRIELGGKCNTAAPGVTGSASCQSTVCNEVAGGVCVAAGICGNSILEAGEACDDGNTAGGDACDSACKRETGSACNATAPGIVGDASCTTGICNEAAGGVGVCAARKVCGNSVLEPGEGCDDGNSAAGDGCSATCTIEKDRPCNGDVAGQTGNTSCATGLCNQAGGAFPGTCVAKGTCGNGTVDPGEACDDGNTRDGDSCTARCKVSVGAACVAGAEGDVACVSGWCDPIGGVCAPIDESTFGGGGCTMGGMENTVGGGLFGLCVAFAAFAARRRRNTSN